MPLAHICTGCGFDLARLRPAPDPHYGLPLLHCPDCGRTVVRRPAVGRTWRRLQGLDLALGLLAFNSFALIVLLAASTSWMGVMVDATKDRTLGQLWSEAPAGVLLAGIVLPVALGAWLTFGLPHWRRGVAWLVFGGLAATVLGAISMGVVLELHASLGLGPDASPWLGEFLDFWRRGVALLVLFMTVATLGIVPGLGVSWLVRRGRSWAWRWRLNRSRRDRRG